MSTTAITTTAVDRLLELIAAGRGAEAADLYGADSVLDATVPGWRFQKTGGPRIAAVWSGWFAEPAVFEDLERFPTSEGEVVRYVARGVQEGTPFVVHHCHIVTLDASSSVIVRHRAWCGGRWYPDRLQEMADAQRADDDL